MIDSGYLAAGLNAMARAYRVNPMAGHLGAAVVAGCFIAEQHPDLDAEVCRGIQGELDRIVRGESVFSPKENAAIRAPQMFEPFAEETTDGSLIAGIADALDANIEETRESGHNVIFASIAIRALRERPDLTTPSVVEGICKLIAGFNGASPGSGYYGKEEGRRNGRDVSVPKDDSFPPYVDLAGMANAVVDELVRHAPERREGFGGLWHIINHGAALAELARHGHAGLAVKGLPSHHHHVQLWRTLPNVADELGPETPAPHDPRTAAFWRSGSIRRERAHLTHRIKTLYGFDALMELVDDESKRRQGNDSLRYLM